MANRRSWQIEHAEAFTIAMATENYDSGWRKFRREFSYDTRDALIPIFDRAWDRASRVKYLTRTNKGQFLNKDRLGCPEGGNQLFYNFRVGFTDPDGNRFDHFINVSAPVMRRIGQNLEVAFSEVLQTLRDSHYFTGKNLEYVQSHVTDLELTNVKCLTGGD
jgi:hypothetical protein